ncbi:MAG TPA: YggT family protein [Ktedonobacteraceae bacterium]|nr:YggT family protein [Ktedonobacteraceae bacterium]
MLSIVFSIASIIIAYGLGIIVLAVIVRGFALMFGFDERVAFIRFLARITDPFMLPVRRIVGRSGRFDMSYLIVIFLLSIMIRLFLQALPS